VAWGFEVDPLVVLAVSELVTNAIVHGDGPVGLTVGADDDQVRIEVSDDGDGDPALRARRPHAEDPGGWGLQFVDRAADEWGVRHEDGRTVVWLVRRCTPDDASLP
jgi:anti-sigma regulatory factor (Ser/Thr protein kinase)